MPLKHERICHCVANTFLLTLAPKHPNNSRRWPWNAQKITAYTWCQIQTHPSVHKYSKANSKWRLPWNAKNTAYNWCHIQTQPSVRKYSKASSKTKIEQIIPYNRTFNILGCIKYDRPNYDLAMYWGTKNMVIRKPVSNYILMHRTFYVVFFTSYTG